MWTRLLDREAWNAVLADLYRRKVYSGDVHVVNSERPGKVCRFDTRVLCTNKCAVGGPKRKAPLRTYTCACASRQDGPLEGRAQEISNLLYVWAIPCNKVH